MTKKTRKQNKLHNSNSPYLLQHANNPVNWYPWSSEAFGVAEKVNKPIFLSIGYSTCHWCHVMAHESFENQEVAELLNKYFISIKVDREEMPEVDHLYMSVCQAITGRGGWPLTIAMTPKKEPFFAGTYFPKNQIGQRPGMLQIIPSLANAWSTKQIEINESIKNIHDYLISINASFIGDDWRESMVKSAIRQFRNRFDSKNGGFSQAPKFPSAHNLIFLLRYSKLYNDPKLLKMVEKTLRKMRKGGIFDQVGYGFHRYSTDENWLLPHFEKMLYDQAMLSLAYMEAYHLTQNKDYARVAEEIFQYVLGDLTHENGGFYSAEDADSGGIEGNFYTWKKKELIDVLGEKNGEIIGKFFGFKKEGNYLDETTHKINGKNIPHIKMKFSELTALTGMTEYELANLIEFSRKKLFEARKKKPRPMKDDKILTDWNGLMIASLAYGGQILNEIKYTDHAERAAYFIYKNLRKKNGRLLKSFRNECADISPHFDDYAYMIFGLLNLYESTFKVFYLSWSLDLAKIIEVDFFDESGGFFIGSKDSEKLIVRAKSGYDSAMPSGNSVAITNFFRLGIITGDTRWITLSRKSLASFSEQAKNTPTGFANMHTGFITYNNSKVLVVVAESYDHKIQKIIQEIKSHYSPSVLIIFKDISDPDKLDSIAPWLSSYKCLQGMPTFYFCEDFACKQPTTNIKTILNLL